MLVPLQQKRNLITCMYATTIATTIATAGRRRRSSINCVACFVAIVAAIITAPACVHGLLPLRCLPAQVRFSALSRASTGFVTASDAKPRWTTAVAMSTTAGDDPLTSSGLPGPLILGSASFTRKLILKEMGVPFQIIKRPIDEKALGDRCQDAPMDLVLTLAKAKMDHLISEIQAGNCEKELPDGVPSSAVVLTGDQVVTCDGKILEKPETVEEAKQFVSSYGKHPPSTVGSCVLHHIPSGIQVSGVDTATIHFVEAIPEDLIDRLLKEDEPILSCAGGLMVEHPFVKEHIVSIDGTEDSVMGLSKDLVLKLFADLRQKLDAQEEAS
uniref:Maf-like protein n=1 Tax=Craspedostauros australis TaxID=1486917 RepID=A0A7R9ZPK8_9STRA